MTLEIFIWIIKKDLFKNLFFHFFSVILQMEILKIYQHSEVYSEFL